MLANPDKAPWNLSLVFRLGFHGNPEMQQALPGFGQMTGFICHFVKRKREAKHLTFRLVSL
jgi:hypothetical protein